MPTPTVINKYRYSDVINRRYWDNKYFFDSMSVNPANSKVGGAAAAGASAEADVMITNKNAFEYYNIVGNTALGPSLDGAVGLNLCADNTATHGVEYDTGITPQNNFTFLTDTTGNTTAAFFVKAQFQLTTVAGASIIVGFRKLAARSQTLNYSDFAAIGIVGAAGHIQTETNLASAGVVTTDSTQLAVNATLFQVAVLVDAFGNVTYQLNGNNPTVTVAYQFANNLTVMPFIRVVTGTGSVAKSCNYFECGFQS